MIRFDLDNQLGIPELPNYLSEVDRQIGKIALSASPVISKPVLRMLKTHGKRLRPSLALACALSNGAKFDGKLLSACTAVELVHIASLVHDDIIDDADSRWGQASIYKKEGLTHALLVGDFLFAQACHQGAAISTEAAQLVAKTITTLCNGEANEMTENFNSGRTEQSLYSAMTDKTAALISASCELGGMCAELSKPQTKALATFGHNFGISFQIIDDVLDFISTQKLSGKPIGNDIKEGVYTLPLILALAGPGGNDLKELLKMNPKQITKILINGGYVKQALIEVEVRNNRAKDSLKHFKNTEKIAAFPTNYQHWAIKNLVPKEYQIKLGY